MLDARKYGSSAMPIFGFVIKNAVTSRHIWGSALKVKTYGWKKTNCDKLMIPAYPNADITTAAAVMVLVTGGSVQKTSMMGSSELSR